nr:hypothetical protein [Acetobacter sp. P5B1]
MIAIWPDALLRHSQFFGDHPLNPSGITGHANCIGDYIGFAPVTARELGHRTEFFSNPTFKVFGMQPAGLSFAPINVRTNGEMTP